MRKILLALMATGLCIAIAAFNVTPKPKTKDKDKSKPVYYWYRLEPGGDPGYYLDYYRVGYPYCTGAGIEICGCYAEPYSMGDLNHPNMQAVVAFQRYD